jgi:hypothetical protein
LQKTPLRSDPSRRTNAMKEKKIPLSEAYVKTQRFRGQFVEIASLVPALVIFGVFILMCIVAVLTDRPSEFILNFAIVFVICGLPLCVVAFMAAIYRRSLSERYELYKTMKQHLAEGHGEAA